MCHIMMNRKNRDFDIRKQRISNPLCAVCSLCDLGPLWVTSLIWKMEPDTYSIECWENYSMKVRNGELTRPRCFITGGLSHFLMPSLLVPDPQASPFWSITRHGQMNHPEAAFVSITFPLLPNQTPTPKQQEPVVSQCLQDVQIP